MVEIDRSKVISMENRKENKCNVLLVHNYYRISGGEDTVVRSEKELLELNGHKVILYTRNNNEINDFSIAKKLLLPFTMMFSLKTYRDVKKIIVNENINVVHVHNTLNLLSPSVYYAAQKCNVPVVQTVHNFRLLCPGGTFFRDNHICEECAEKGLLCAVKHNCYRNSKIQSLVCVIVQMLHRCIGTYKKIDAYICLSSFSKNKMAGMISEDKIYIKPNFVNIVNNETSNFYEYKKSNYFLFLGRIEQEKGVDFLVNAFEKLPNEKLVVAGDGTLKEWLLNQIEKRKLDNIEFVGFVEKEKKKELIINAKSIIVPSQCYEQFGMVVIEANMYGVPVIASNIGTLPEIVKNGENGFLFEHNSVDGLMNVINDFDRLMTPYKSDNAIHYVEKFFSPQVNYLQLMKVYDQIIEK